MGFFDKIKDMFHVQSEEIDDNYEIAYEQENKIQDVTPSQQRIQHIQKKISEGKDMAKINLVEPRVYKEVENIAPLLLERQAILLNLRRMDEAQATRVIDYLAGIAFAVGGDIQKISSDIFMITPANIEVESILSEGLEHNQLDFLDSI